MKEPQEYTLKDYLTMDDAALQNVLRALSDKELVFLHWQVLSGSRTGEAGEGDVRLEQLGGVIKDEESRRFEHEVLKSHKKFRKKLQKRSTDSGEAEEAEEAEEAT